MAGVGAGLLLAGGAAIFLARRRRLNLAP